MGAVARFLLALLGVILLVGGVGAAIIVGPDDTAYLPVHEVGAADGVPIVSSRGLLEYDGFTMHVRAKSADQVFLGAGNPVDVTDYTEESSRFVVSRVEPSGGVSGRSHDGGELAAAPDKVDFWTERATGAGEQHISVALDGTPTQILAASLGKEGPMSLAFGATLDGLFVTALLVAGAGLLMLALMILGRRRTRRRPVDAGHTSSDPPHPATHDDLLSRRIGVPALVVGLLLATSGCVSIPEKVAVEEPTKVPLTKADLTLLLDDLDTREAKAHRAAMAPRYDIDQWQAVNTGPEYDHTVVTTKLAKGAKTPAKKMIRTVERGPLQVFAGEFRSYPMWAILTASASYTPDVRDAEEKKKDRAYDEFLLVTRAAAAEPWLIESDGPILRKGTPDALAPGAARIGDAAATARAEAIAGEIAAFWKNKKRVPRRVTVDDDVRNVHTVVRRLGRPAYIKRAYADTALYGARGSTQSIRTVQVADGTLAMITFRLDLVSEAKPGRTLRWVDSWAEAFGSAEEQTHTRRFVAILPVFLPDDLKQNARVIGGEYPLVGATGS